LEQYRLWYWGHVKRKHLLRELGVLNDCIPHTDDSSIPYTDDSSIPYTDDSSIPFTDDSSHTDDSSTSSDNSSTSTDTSSHTDTCAHTYNFNSLPNMVIQLFWRCYGNVGILHILSCAQ
jgi:hypothetical protein